LRFQKGFLFNDYLKEWFKGSEACAFNVFCENIEVYYKEAKEFVAKKNAV
jgi:hypothetical protein